MLCYTQTHTQTDAKHTHTHTHTDTQTGPLMGVNGGEVLVEARGAWFVMAC